MKTLIYSRIGSIAIGSMLFASVLGFAPVTNAAQLTTAQINGIVDMLQAFNVNPATITTVRNVLEGNPSTTTGSTSTTTTSTTATTTQSNSNGNAFGNIIQNMQNASSTCGVVSQHLSFGDSSEAVRKVQQFLASKPGIYPQGIVSGYYGALTEDAVRRWQAQQGIVATGTPGTTGYGAIGPATLHSINHELEVECEVKSSESHAGDSSNTSSTTSSDGQHSSDGSTSSVSTASSSVSSDSSSSSSSDN